MRKMGMLIAVAMMGCATTNQGTTASETPRPLLRVFDNGGGRVLDFDRGVAAYEHAWDTGVLPGAQSHGAPMRDSGWTGQREGSLQVSARTQSYADGTTIYRELAADGAGHLVRIRFYDTHMDGTRQGFRLDGTLPGSVAFGSSGAGGALSAHR